MGQPIRLEPPTNALSRALGVQNAMQQNALNGMQMQDMQAQRQDRQTQAQARAQMLAQLPPPPPDAPPEWHQMHKAVVSGVVSPKDYFDLVMKPKPERKLTVVGKTALDSATGQPVYSEPTAPDKPPSAVQEYEYAKSQGYAGSFTEWKNQNAKAGAASTSVSYGAPIAGVDANGNPVFFQPDKKGGAPAIVPGVSPPKKDTPAALQEKLAQNAVTLQKIDKALELVSANPDSLGLKNYMGDPVMQRVDPSGVEVRAMIADIGGQKIHDRSGAAVTVGEAERLKPYIPAATDSPAAAKKKLELFRKEYSAMQQAIQSGASVSQAASKNAAASAGGVVNFSDLK